MQFELKYNFCPQFLTSSLLIKFKVCEEDEEDSGGIPIDDIAGVFIIVSVGVLIAVIGRDGKKDFLAFPSIFLLLPYHM